MNAYWGLEFNPFGSQIPEDRRFESNDHRQAMARLEHLKSIKGIGLVTGSSGTGKTFTLRCFSKSLHPNLYKVVYLPLSTVTVMEFYRSLAYGLDIEPAFRKIDLFKSIQERIVSLEKDRKISTVILLDECQYLKSSVFNDLILITNFFMDSKAYATMVLNGQPVLNDILSKSIHESLRQRIVIRYHFEGITKEELFEYVRSRLKLGGVKDPIFEDGALEALYSCYNRSIRKLNATAEKCLMIGAQKKSKTIDTDIVMEAQNEVELI